MKLRVFLIAIVISVQSRIRLMVALVMIGTAFSSLANARTITQDFATYLKRFSHEAAIRGITLDRDRVNRLSIDFGFNLHDYNTLAECNRDTLHISVSESYWLTASGLEREELIFHELGHCILGRGHDDELMPISGGHVFKSIMNSGGNALMYRFPEPNNCGENADCGDMPIFAPKSKNNFYAKYRKIYLDELFGAFAPNAVAEVPKKSTEPKKQKVPSPLASASPGLHKGKLKKGMSRQEVVDLFGEPIDVAERTTGPGGDMWDRWNFKGRFCQYSLVSQCYVYFDTKTKTVVSWSDIKPQYTDYMSD